MPDYFVVLGEPYKRLRETVAKTVTFGDARYLDDLIKVGVINSLLRRYSNTILS